MPEHNTNQSPPSIRSQGPLDVDAAVRYALGRLEAELAPALIYHSLRHTRDEVLAGVQRLAALSRLTPAESDLVRVGAAYHDLGFIVQYDDHERVGADLAALLLPVFGFDGAQVRLVTGMIIATRLPQSPHTRLEQIVADADLDVLGRDDFWPRNLDLRQEVAAYGRTFDDVAWCTQQLRFLQAHTYFTPAAQALRGAGKLRNIAALQARLESARHA